MIITRLEAESGGKLTETRTALQAPGTLHEAYGTAE